MTWKVPALTGNVCLKVLNLLVGRGPGDSGSESKSESRSFTGTGNLPVNFNFKLRSQLEVISPNPARASAAQIRPLAMPVPSLSRGRPGLPGNFRVKPSQPEAPRGPAARGRAIVS